MINLTYQYKLEPTKAQSQTMSDWLETSRKVWNYALGERKDWYKSRSCRIDACSIKSEYVIPADAQRPTFASQCKALTEAKQSNPDFKVVQSAVLQQVLKRLEHAFTSMWERGFGFPRLKKARQFRSLTFPQLADHPVQGNRIKIPKMGLVKVRWSRPIPDGFVIKQAQVVRKASGWYVMLTLPCDVDVPSPTAKGNAMGLDVGLQSLVATSDKELVPAPKFFVNLPRKLRLLQKRASRKQQGSSNWKKAQHRVAKLHEHISNCRQDFFYKLAHRLCDRAGMVFIEDLNFIAWAKGLFWKHMLDASFGEFFRILEWVCWKRDVLFLKVDASHTSQICPECG
ncbi:MAG: transposase, partial [Cyanobacteria bacterium SW_7_48_12]